MYDTVTGDEVSGRQPALQVIPYMIAAVVGFAIHSPLAKSYPFAARLIAFWIVADTLLLARILENGCKIGF